MTRWKATKIQRHLIEGVSWGAGNETVHFD